jgi:hypothetical protein
MFRLHLRLDRYSCLPRSRRWTLPWRRDIEGPCNPFVHATPDLIDALNGADLTDMQISVDGVNPNDVTVKTLQPLPKKLELLAEKATFRVVMSGVIGSAPPEDVLDRSWTSRRPTASRRAVCCFMTRTGSCGFARATDRAAIAW